MTQTFLWITYALHNEQWKKQIIAYMEGDDQTVLYDCYRLEFNKEKKYVIAQCADENDPRAVKISPAKIPYDVLARMLEGDWDDCRGIEYLGY